MYLIAICGGGGKTTLAKKYPNFFLDIDEFVWSNQNEKYHKNLISAFTNKNNNELGKQYKIIFQENKEKLKKLNKIILAHHPINAEWINVLCLGIYRPTKSLHQSNIQNRSDTLKQISINSWNSMNDENVIEYSTNQELENILCNHYYSKYPNVL